MPLLHFGWSDLRVLREGRWKYIQAPRPELFDLAADPGETNNRAAAEPARAAAFQAALGRMLDEERKAASAAPGGAVPVELLEKLGALGYVGGAAPAQTSTPGADPKDRIADFRLANALMREGLIALNERDFAKSAAQFGQLLERGIVSFEAHLYLGRALLGPGPARRGGAPSRRGRAPRARAGRRLAQPGAPRAWPWARSARRSRRTSARCPSSPKDARLRVQRGRAAPRPGAAGQGHRATARGRGPRSRRMPSAWNALGMTLGGSGRLDEAEAAFRKAVRAQRAEPPLRLQPRPGPGAPGPPRRGPPPGSRRPSSSSPGFTPARASKLAAKLRVR